MCSPISAASSAESLRHWVSQLAILISTHHVPVWGWLSAKAPMADSRVHIPLNRLRPLTEWVTHEPNLQGGGEFWLLTVYQGHLLAVVVANSSGAWSVRQDRFQSWGWS